MQNTSAPFNEENLFEFDQTAYVWGKSMGPKGYYYAPKACQDGRKCRLHVAFHGCSQTLGNVGTKFVVHAGYNEVAEANDIVVLYPQVKTSTLNPVNLLGCWDWFGYNEPTISLDKVRFATKEGDQIAAVWKMIQDLTNQQKY